jgi:hypothetical protein
MRMSLRSFWIIHLSTIIYNCCLCNSNAYKMEKSLKKSNNTKKKNQLTKEMKNAEVI